MPTIGPATARLYGHGPRQKGVRRMDYVTAFVSGFPDFLFQLVAAIALFIVALTIYVLLTPHKELALIREGNPSASLAFAGVVLGLAIPLSACIANSMGLIEVVLWGAVTLLIQLLAFRLTDMFLRNLPRRIAEGDVAAAIFLLAVKLGLGVIMAGAASDPALSGLPW